MRKNKVYLSSIFSYCIIDNSLYILQLETIAQYKSLIEISDDDTKMGKLINKTKSESLSKQYPIAMQ
jgi:hypothetical protein